MRARVWTDLLIFIGSYFPLSLILFVQDLDLRALDLTNYETLACVKLKHPIIALCCLLLCAACLGLSAFILFWLPKKIPVTVESAKAIPAELLSYILPYIVAFVSLDYEDKGKLLGFLVFFTLMFVITRKTGQTMLNPLLAAFGWRLYAVSFRYEGDQKTFEKQALSKTTIESGRPYLQSSIGEIYVFRPRSMKEDAIARAR